MFNPVNATPDYRSLEASVLEFWKQAKIFAKTEGKDTPRGEWVFYEGPPTANGKPAMHHVLARSFKDLFPRYRVMRGHHVTRKGGWDTHGLPVEIAVEKRLGWLGRQHASREEMEEFNRLCRESVFENIQDWNHFTERLGFWVDLEHAYITYKNSYIESVWNLLKRLWDKGFIEEDYKVVPLSPRISTTLSAAEISDGYRDVQDPSVYVRLPVKLEQMRETWKTALQEQGVEIATLENLSLLIWTTTPWTLPTNTAVAVNPELEYVIVRSRSGDLVIALDAIERISSLKPLQSEGVASKDEPEELKVLARFPGRVLEFVAYEPPFPEVFVEEGVQEKAHFVVLADFVTASDGCGLAHASPAYGADDLVVCRRYGLPVVFGVDDHGILQVTTERGKFFKEADRGLMRMMRERGVLYAAGTIVHSYPFHDRTGDPVLYFAKRSWFIRTSQMRDRLVARNEEINWVPEYIKEGRFGNWLANNVDWAISRERYWGTPLPFWRAEDGETICVGSVGELEELTGCDLSGLDLHRPFIDEITFEKNGKAFRRTKEVLDVWFDSGAMPYAQWHLIEAAKQQNGIEAFEKHFPADFICEAVDQTRGWFYSLHAIATLLYDSVAFRNVICLGHIVDERGQKMSKSKGNVIEPLPIFDRYGADSVRWYMFTASEPGDPKRFSERLVAEAQRGYLNTLWNVYAFFVLYANIDKPDLEQAPPLAERPEIDRWLISRLEQTIFSVTEALETYQAREGAQQLERFVDELSNWYVRRSRRRFWKNTSDADKLAAYSTLYEVLAALSTLTAPFTPFAAEAIYQNLVKTRGTDAPDSVHLCAWPEHNPERLDDRLCEEMELVLRTVDLGRAARGQANIKLRQPLGEALVRARSAQDNAALERLAELIAEELNVKTVRLETNAELVRYTIRPNLPVLGRRLGALIPAIRKALETADASEIAEAARLDKTIQLETSDGIVTLEPADLLIDAQGREGYAAAEQNGLLVALNSEITRELELEGQARDLIRSIQQARKDSGFEISDRIELWLELNDGLLEAAKAFEQVIKEETLALGLGFSTPPTDVTTIEISGGRVGLRRLE